MKMRNNCSIKWIDDIEWYLVSNINYVWRVEISISKWCVYRAFQKICSTATTDISRIIYIIFSFFLSVFISFFLSLSLSHNVGSLSNKFPEQNSDAIYLLRVLGNSVYNPTFREFFPVVKCFVPLKNTRDSFAQILFITKRWKASPVGKIKSGSTFPREKGVSRENGDRYLAQEIQTSRELAWIQLKSRRENSIKAQSSIVVSRNKSHSIRYRSR